MSNILLLNGPNLNFLGKREPGLYGSKSLAEVVAQLTEQASAKAHRLTHFQSQSEGELIERLYQAKEEADRFVIINPAALTHTSIALRDAFLAVELPFIELHLSNIAAREPFRHHSYLADIAYGVLFGFGIEGYRLALEAAMAYCHTLSGD